MRNKFLLFPVLAVLGLGACEADPAGLRDGEGRLVVQLTDASGDLAAAWVVVERVRLIGVSEEEESQTLDFDPEASDWIDLLGLSGGEVLGLVDGAAVPAGDYSELRLYLDGAYVELEDGRVFATRGAELPSGVTSDGELKCPSCSQSGFKVKFMNGGVEIDEDETTSVVIDFDVAQSFLHEAGLSGQWIMQPVLRAATSAGAFSSFSGTVTLASGVSLPPSCGGQAITLAHLKPELRLGTEVFIGTVDAQGAFTFSSLIPGTYTVPATVDVTFGDGDILRFGQAGAVTVADWGQTLTAGNLQITSATCVPKP